MKTSLERIEHQMKQFRVSLEPSPLSPRMKNHYLALKRMLLETEQIADGDLLARAKRIKPLMRIQADFVDECGLPKGTLVFIHPEDLRQSYYYRFGAKSILCDEESGEPLPVGNVTEVARFICYHCYGGCNVFLRPSADEVLAQIPPSVHWQDVDAFEVQFESYEQCDVYDNVLDRHISTVILYRLERGLPEQLRNQPIILDKKTYESSIFS